MWQSKAAATLLNFRCVTWITLLWKVSCTAVLRSFQSLEVHIAKSSSAWSCKKKSTLRSYCRGKIDFVVAPFDLKSLEQAAKLDVDVYKVDPQCATDMPLLEALAQFPKPIIISVGMCSAAEVGELVRVLRGCALTLMYCVVSDPTPVSVLNLRAMGWLRQFGCPVGFVDTTDGGVMGPVAVALGASAMEKRLTLNRNARGFNHTVSLEPDELKRYVQNIRGVEQALPFNRAGFDAACLCPWEGAL